jgi:hypothetical protein
MCFICEVRHVDCGRTYVGQNWLTSFRARVGARFEILDHFFKLFLHPILVFLNLFSLSFSFTMSDFTLSNKRKAFELNSSKAFELNSHVSEKRARGESLLCDECIAAACIQDRIIPDVHVKKWIVSPDKRDVYFEDHLYQHATPEMFSHDECLATAVARNCWKCVNTIRRSAPVRRIPVTQRDVTNAIVATCPDDQVRKLKARSLRNLILHTRVGERLSGCFDQDVKLAQELSALFKSENTNIPSMVLKFDCYDSNKSFEFYQQLAHNTKYPHEIFRHIRRHMFKGHHDLDHRVFRLMHDLKSGFFTNGSSVDGCMYCESKEGDCCFHQRCIRISDKNVLPSDTLLKMLKNNMHEAIFAQKATVFVELSRLVEEDIPPDDRIQTFTCPIYCLRGVRFGKYASHWITTDIYKQNGLVDWRHIFNQVWTTDNRNLEPAWGKVLLDMQQSPYSLPVPRMFDRVVSEHILPTHVLAGTPGALYQFAHCAYPTRERFVRYCANQLFDLFQLSCGMESTPFYVAIRPQKIDKSIDRFKSGLQAIRTVVTSLHDKSHSLVSSDLATFRNTSRVLLSYHQVFRMTDTHWNDIEKLTPPSNTENYAPNAFVEYLVGPFRQGLLDLIKSLGDSNDRPDCRYCARYYMFEFRDYFKSLVNNHIEYETEMRHRRNLFKNIFGGFEQRSKLSYLQLGIDDHLNDLCMSFVRDPNVTIDDSSSDSDSSDSDWDA